MKGRLRLGATGAGGRHNDGPPALLTYMYICRVLLHLGLGSVEAWQDRAGWCVCATALPGNPLHVRVGAGAGKASGGGGQSACAPSHRKGVGHRRECYCLSIYEGLLAFRAETKRFDSLWRRVSERIGVNGFRPVRLTLRWCRVMQPPPR